MIVVSEQDGIALLALAHGRANALDIELCEALAACLEDLRKTPARAVVITGQGTIFSAGVDLLRLGDGGAPYVRRFLPALHRLYDAAFFFPKPMVAAINGHAIAGGCVLAACADRRLMASGRIGITELLVGVPFPALAFEIMRFVVPQRYLSDAVLGGATHAPETALERGLIDEIVAPPELEARALAVARRLAALSPEAFALSKRQLRQTVADRVAQTGAQIEAEVTAIWSKPETLARVRDYVARTLRKT